MHLDRRLQRHNFAFHTRCYFSPLLIGAGHLHQLVGVMKPWVEGRQALPAASAGGHCAWVNGVAPGCMLWANERDHFESWPLGRRFLQLPKPCIKFDFWASPFFLLQLYKQWWSVPTLNTWTQWERGVSKRIWVYWKTRWGQRHKGGGEAIGTRQVWGLVEGPKVL